MSGRSAMDVTAAAHTAATSDLLNQGAHVLPERLDQAAATSLLDRIRATRAFDGSLFLSEEAFRADPQYTGVNPRPGRNLLDTLEAHLGFVEQAPIVRRTLTEILGEGYTILNRKIVCGVPDRSVPDWVKALIAGNPVNNLGAFMRPEYRDITYFYGIDFHQDIIDYKGRDADFVTLYIYLHPVTRADAPLFLLDGSHALGATVFPHDLTREADGQWRYADRRGAAIPVRQRVLTGDTGFAALWHPFTLHGTQPDIADHERISLRYLMAKSPGARGSIDDVNARLHGPLRLEDTRVDLGADGAAVIRQNTVNAA